VLFKFGCRGIPLSASLRR